jgi:hypothetical protein
MLKLNLLSPSRFQRTLVRHADSAYDRWLVSHSNPVDLLSIELVKPIRRRKDQQLRIEKRKEIEQSVKAKEEQVRNSATDRRHRTLKVGNISMKALRSDTYGAQRKLTTSGVLATSATTPANVKKWAPRIHRGKK